MYNVTQISPPIISTKKPNLFYVPPQFFGYSHYSSTYSKMVSLSSNYFTFSSKIRSFGCPIKALTNYSEQGSVQGFDSSPISVELEPIACESQFDRVIAEAQQLEESVIILWMATWCRKCIYLKPKLEKLAVDYYPSLHDSGHPFNQTNQGCFCTDNGGLGPNIIRFFCVDVNNVSHKLIVRAGVLKMPTIQLWKDSKKQAEVIGGSKAYLVINEVCEMIENESAE